MGTWKTGSTSLLNKIGSTFNKGLNTVKSLWNDTVGRTVDQVESLFKNGTTVVGIRVSAIPDMKTAIRNYVDGINAVLNELSALDPTIAFKGGDTGSGGYAAAVQDYILAVKETCACVVSNMLAFNDQLTEVQTAYQEKDIATAQRVNTEAETTRSSFQGYTEGQS